MSRRLRGLRSCSVLLAASALAAGAALHAWQSSSQSVAGADVVQGQGAGAGEAPPARPAVGPFPTWSPHGRHVARLENGLAVVVERYRGTPAVWLNLVVPGVQTAGTRAGARTDGGNAVAAALLARAAADLSVAGPGRTFAQCGATVTATSDERHVVLSARAPAPFVDHILAALGQLAGCRFTAAEARAELAEVERRRARDLAVPWSRVEYEVRRVLASDSERPRPRADASPADPLCPLSPERAMLIVTGDVDPARVATSVRRSLGAWKRQGGGPSLAPARSPEEAAPTRAPRVIFVNRPGSLQATLSVAVEGPALAQRDGAAFEVLNAIYGGYTNSRMFRRLVLEKGWSYGPLSVVRPVAGQDAFMLVRADTANETVPDVLAELLRLMEDLAGAPVPESEFRDAVGYLRGMYLLQAATGPARLQQLTTAVRAGLDAGALDAYPARLSRLHAGEVRQLASRSFASSRRIIVIVGDHARLATGLSFLGEMKVIDAAPSE